MYWYHVCRKIRTVMEKKLSVGLLEATKCPSEVSHADDLLPFERLHDTYVILVDYR